MKKIYIKIILSFTILINPLSGKVFGEITNKNSGNQNRINQIIERTKFINRFTLVDLFKFNREKTNSKQYLNFVRSAYIMDVNKENLKELLRHPEENIMLKIPTDYNKFTEVELTRNYVLSDDFILTSMKSGYGKNKEKYTPGLYYWGTIKNSPNSIAAISVFEDEIIGVLSDITGNYVLGELDDGENPGQYIFYNDADLLVKNSFKCGIDDFSNRFMKGLDVNPIQNGKTTEGIQQLPVKVYFEADYQLYQDKGSNLTNVSNYITGMFNVVKLLYQNENIPFLISEISVWTATDPYANLNSSVSILLKFGGRTKDNFQGNLANLLSTRTENMGGIAWIRVLCQPYNQSDSSGRYAFCNIDNTYSNYPTYSWTVTCVTHEMGHNLGSMHTHACWWPTAPGVIGAIDSCYYAEGNCFSGWKPAIGTIMSYCHLTAPAGGINLSLGFGPLPGDTIRLRYNQAGCLKGELNSSEKPYTTFLMQNFPNPFNPSTNIKYALNSNSYVSLTIYDINGKIVANLFNNKFHEAGIYSYVFNAGNYLLSSGIYLYKLTAKDETNYQNIYNETKKMLFIK